MGRSKKEAEQQAAKMALEELRKIEFVPATGAENAGKEPGAHSPGESEPPSPSEKET
jgi:hypothetical protein